MHHISNMNRFFCIANAILPIFCVVSAGMFPVGLYYALIESPADYQQGDTVRIMYVHVPAAWGAMICYLTMAMASAVFLIYNQPLANLAARAAAPIGAGFTLIVLVTGSFWGQPVWGTGWVWDARLTSVLILFFLYLGYIALANAFEDPDRGGRAGAVLALVGAINLPIIKFSVDWWNTLHQSSSLWRIRGPSIVPEMLLPLLLMGCAYFSLFVVMMILRLRGLYAGRLLRQMRIAAASR
ncbi:heme exporter subunit C [Candidatus Endolissoclinum faulkneri L5]|uniref:Heme exporter protein C n=1 Tax=Candidatus Endolissoclinum faulkneri L5 TaxID=1401328 RepID=V9TUZ9_9PROT|nr:heme ABC transporter permease [Candidatus Endolissoclinum faulkneri]AHC73523.1 heme exporter subunit C [Candidatus Endolissoclinum faulkneri L5]